jgi:hypothetical protein
MENRLKVAEIAVPEPLLDTSMPALADPENQVDTAAGDRVPPICTRAVPLRL